MKEIRIRKALASDSVAIIDFNVAMAFETERKKLDPEKLGPGVRAVFTDDRKGFYILAEDEKQTPLGALLVTTEWSDWRDGWFWWIQSVYIKPEFRGLGIYSDMYSYVKSLADIEEDVCGYRLYVEKDNKHAQDVYRACGMDETNYLMYEELIKKPETP